MSSISCENKVVAALDLRSPDGGQRSIDLRDGERLFVGSDRNSDICLTDDGVASSHCVISAVAGVVSVQDCYSDAGTVVDGERIREIQLTQNAELCLGTALIAVTFRRQSAAASISTLPDRHDTPPREIETQSPFNVIEELQAQLAQAHAEVHVLQDRLMNTAAPVATANEDPYQVEMIELLRAEVLDLQAILAEQDNDSSNGTQAEAGFEAIGDVLPQAEAERLVERLEQLLTELQERDEQVSTLTQLLNAAEETSRAEREERDQLNGWMRDIEERFGSREQEWQLHRQTLEQAIQTITAERDHAETAINADTSNAKLEAMQTLMNGLRQTAESQRQQLKESETEIAELRQQLQRSNNSQIREQMAQLAEERAEVARQRQELEAARQTENRSAPNDATLKLQALRQHLNEIHVQEQQEKEERKLSSRIAKLWSRLDGRS